MVFRGLSLSLAILGLLFRGHECRTRANAVVPHKGQASHHDRCRNWHDPVLQGRRQAHPARFACQGMTMEVVFHALKSDRYTMEDTFAVSETRLDERRRDVRRFDGCSPR